MIERLEIEASCLDSALSVAFGRLKRLERPNGTWRIEFRAVEMNTSVNYVTSFKYVFYCHLIS
jgi:hypothetical protein